MSEILDILGNAAFWGLMATSLLFGSAFAHLPALNLPGLSLAGEALGNFINGLLVLALAGLAGFGFIGRSAPPTTTEGERLTLSYQLGNRLFLPALIIPATALIGTLAYNYTDLSAWGWIEERRETYIFLCLVIYVSDNTYTIELTGSGEKLDAFIHALDASTILETVRTGTSGIGRGNRILRV